MQRHEGRPNKSRRQENAILEILSRWDTVRGFPADKYESLARRILSALRRGVSGAEMEALILNDMQFYLGIDVPEYEVRKVRREIMIWWRS